MRYKEPAYCGASGASTEAYLPDYLKISYQKSSGSSSGGAHQDLYGNYMGQVQKRKLKELAEEFLNCKI